MVRFFFFLFFFSIGITSPSNVPEPCEAEQMLKKLGLVDLQEIDRSIQVELKYSTADNFLKFDVYSCLSKAYLQKEVAAKLSGASDMLKKTNPELSLLVYDAARPSWAQKLLWDKIDKPESSKHIYVANPRRGSIHNYGCAVDLTLAYSNGKPLDMGTDFDYFGNLAQPRLENENLRKGLLTKVQIKNRQLLRKVMQEAGFQMTSSEWWHFNFCSLKTARKKFKIIP